MQFGLRSLLLASCFIFPLAACTPQADGGAASLQTEEARAQSREGISRSFILTREGKAEDALALLDSLPQAVKQHTGALNARAVALDYLGRHKDAQQFYAQALLVAPNSAMLRNNMALSHIFSEQYDEAIKLLQPLSASPQSSPTIRQNLALAYGMKGERERALNLLKRDLSEEKAQQNLAFYEHYRSKGLKTTPSVMAAPVTLVESEPAAAEPESKPAPKPAPKPSQVTPAKPKAPVAKPPAPKEPAKTVTPKSEKKPEVKKEVSKTSNATDSSEKKAPLPLAVGEVGADKNHQPHATRLNTRPEAEVKPAEPEQSAPAPAKKAGEEKAKEPAKPAPKPEPKMTAPKAEEEPIEEGNEPLPDEDETGTDEAPDPVSKLFDDLSVDHSYPSDKR